MSDLSARVAEAFRSLPARYLGAEPGFDATYHVRLGDIGRSWEVRCTALGARVRAGATRRTPDVVIGTDAETWLALREGELSGRRGVPAAAPVRARRPRPRGRLRRPVPAPQRPPAAAAHPPGAGRQAADLDADDGLRAGHAAPARARRHQVELLRHRRRAQPPLHRPRARPAGLRRLVQARHRALRRPVRRPRRDRHDGRAEHRARPHRRQLDGRPRRDRGRPRAAGPGRRAGAAQPRDRVHAPRLALARAVRAARARDAAALVRPRPDRADVLGDVRRPRPRRSERRRHRRRRVRAHLPLAGRPAGVPLERPLDLSRIAGEVLSAAGDARAARAVRLGLARPADPGALPPARRALAAERRARRARGLRPRPADRAPGPHQRPAGAVLRARRPARRIRLQAA